MLQAETRQPKMRLGALRSSGKIPAVVYGHGILSVPIFIDKQEFLKYLKTEGEGSLIDLRVSGEEPCKAVLHDWQRHILTQEYIHLDFYRIRADEKMRAKVHLVFTGEAPAVKAGGVLVKNKDHIEVLCLPKDLVSRIVVDLSSLSEPHNSIKVRDLQISPGVSVLAHPDDIVATIAEMKEEVEDAAIAAQKEKEQIEKLKAEPEEKKEGDEGAEKGKEKVKEKAKEKK